MQFYKIDGDGFYVETVHIPEPTDLANDFITVRPPQGLYKPKWTGSEWVEGKTEAEFLEDAFLASLNPSSEELAKAGRELEVIELLLEMGLI